VDEEWRGMESDMIKFFAIFCLVSLLLGASIGLFDLMYNTVLSAILCLIFLSLGGGSGIVASWLYLKSQETHH